MKKSLFKVWFSAEGCDYVVMSALNSTEAVILAQAGRIRRGLPYFNVLRVELRCGVGWREVIW